MSNESNVQDKGRADGDQGDVRDNKQLRPAVSLVEAHLSEISFRKLLSGRPKGGGKVPLRYGLGAIRMAERRFGVEFSIEFDGWEWAELLVSYRAVFELPEDTPEDALEPTMRRAAAMIGPIVMYPYVRQEIDSLLSRADLGREIMPVLNVGSMFDPEAVELDQPQGDLGLDAEP